LCGRSTNSVARSTSMDGSMRFLVASGGAKTRARRYRPRVGCVRTSSL
jgi:hypothetical protein